MKNAEILWIVALAMLGITLLLLTGCATAEYRERLVAERLAEQDRVCRSWGTTPGTPEYLACRQQLSQQYAAAETQREAQHAASRRAMIAAGAAAPPPPVVMPDPPPMFRQPWSCRRVGGEVECQ